MKKQLLHSGWQLTTVGKNDTIPATVPGSVYPIGATLCFAAERRPHHQHIREADGHREVGTAQ